MHKSDDVQLKPIPCLPVIRKDICSQEVVDRVVDEFIKRFPNQLMNLSHYPHPGAGEQMYLSDIKARVRDNLEELALHADPLMCIYLVHEIRRRVHRAYGQEGQEMPLGKPLAPSPTGPFPALPDGKIQKSMEELGFKQKEVDRILEKYYADYPEWWYVMAEELRLRLPLNPPILCPANQEYFPQLLDSKRFNTHINALISILNWDAAARLEKLCEIPLQARITI